MTSPSHVYCSLGLRLDRSFWAPDSCGWVPPRDCSRAFKDSEARISQRDRRDRKRLRGTAHRLTWLVRDDWSLAWTTCGGYVLGPPLGRWEDYPKSRRTRQREKRWRMREERKKWEERKET